MDEELLEDLYSWVDGIPLSRPKKDIRRDFSDGGNVPWSCITHVSVYTGVKKFVGMQFTKYDGSALACEGSSGLTSYPHAVPERVNQAGVGVTIGYFFHCTL